MAGFYPDVPGPRIPYDRDGTQVIWFRLPNTYQGNQAELQKLNNENPDHTWNGNSTPFGSRPGGVYMGLIFPQPMDLTHIYLALGNADSIGATEFSTDSTNLVDGNWTATTTVGEDAFSPVRPDYRNNYAAFQAPLPNGITGLRFSTSQADGNRYINCIHLYGKPSSFAGSDTLRMWHPTLDEPLDDATSADGAYLDWGDVTRGTSADRSFRIKNNSSTLTANTITVSTEVLTNTTPALESQITYSDGGAFSPSLSIGNLAPGSLSSVVTVRKSTDISADLMVWAWRTVAEATSWS